MYNSTSVLDEVDNQEVDQEEITRSQMQNELFEMIGFMSEEGALEQFGITKEEYDNPTDDTLDRVRNIIFSRGSRNDYEEMTRNSNHK